MTLALPELVMIGSSTVSASCCLAPVSPASRPARGLAVCMVALMAAMPLTEAAGPLYLGALLLVGLATALFGASPRSREPSADRHRSAGGILMATVVLLHLHVAETVGGSMAHMPAHDTVIETILRAAVTAYLVWTAVAVARKRRAPGSRLLRWEHLTMGLSLALMTFAMH
jgi:hypothetical protein